jgi:mono/diheme cytochrome c family protein
MRSLVIVIPLTLAVLAGACGKNAQEESSASGPLSEAQALYTKRCVACHGVFGAANGPVADSLTPRPHDYTDQAWQASITDDEIKTIILRGGARVGKSNAMPGNLLLLRDRPEVLNALVKIIRDFGKRRKDGSASAGPLTPRP